MRNIRVQLVTPTCPASLKGGKCLQVWPSTPEASQIEGRRHTSIPSYLRGWTSGSKVQGSDTRGA